MCDANGCEKTTPGGGLCKQCETEQKWEKGDSHRLDGEYTPNCRKCDEPVEEIHYHPDKFGVVICAQCSREANKERDLVADGGFRPDIVPDTVVELRTTTEKITVEVQRSPLATDPAIVDQVRRSEGVGVDEFLGGEVQ